MELIHRKCGRIVFLDASSAVRLLTPSYTADGESISIGIVEPHPSKKKATGSFCCIECDIELPGNSEELLGKCQVCRTHYPTSDLFVLGEIPVVCTGCLQELINRKPSTTRVSEFMRYVNVTKDTPKKSLVSALQQKINI